MNPIKIQVYINEWSSIHILVVKLRDITVCIIVEERGREMELSMKVLVKVASLLFLLGFTATVVDARFDPSSFITQFLPNAEANNYYVKSTTKACCNSCPCTKSIPPQCRCSDIGETCHSACKTCICTRSIPPQCHCSDITNFCYEPCNSSETEAH